MKRSLWLQYGEQTGEQLGCNPDDPAEKDCSALLSDDSRLAWAGVNKMKSSTQNSIVVTKGVILLHWVISQCLEISVIVTLGWRPGMLLSILECT